MSILLFIGFIPYFEISLEFTIPGLNGTLPWRYVIYRFLSLFLWFSIRIWNCSNSVVFFFFFILLSSEYNLRFSQFSGCWLICLFIYLWVLTFPLLDCSEFGNFVITLTYRPYKSPVYASVFILPTIIIPKNILDNVHNIQYENLAYAWYCTKSTI